MRCIAQHFRGGSEFTEAGLKNFSGYFSGNFLGAQAAKKLGCLFKGKFLAGCILFENRWLGITELETLWCHRRTCWYVRLRCFDFEC